MYPCDLSPSFSWQALVWWQQARTQWPLALATACAFCLYGASDALSQCVASGRDRRSTMSLDVRRLLRTGLTASLLSGYLAVFYFGWLEKATCPQAWGCSSGVGAWLSVAAKIAVDVGLYEPIYDVLYITLQAMLRGDDFAAAQREVQSKVLKVWKMAPRYWCFADAINFSLVPLRLRPMTNALFSIPWGMFISSVANTPDERAGEERTGDDTPDERASGALPMEASMYDEQRASAAA